MSSTSVIAVSGNKMIQYAVHRSKYCLRSTLFEGQLKTWLTVRQKIADPRAFPSARQVTSQSERFVTPSANQRRRAEILTNQSALHRPNVL